MTNFWVINLNFREKQGDISTYESRYFVLLNRYVEIKSILLPGAYYNAVLIYEWKQLTH